MSAIKVKDVDHGYQRMLVNLGVGSRRSGARTGFSKHNKLSVGIHSDVASERYKESKARLVDVAAAHEFGLGVPQRSWLRGWFDGRGIVRFGSDLQDAVFASIAGKYIGDALGELGELYLGEIKARIETEIPPPLSPATIRRKESRGATEPDTPLIDTHKFFDALNWQVRLK